ncbi:MAG: hypothetical protein CO133_02355 [Candidatus Komeilibacteria bacterium CG_4_9_14_3_um_filter_37_5]|nr:MAG: hypothetical protein CO133_02355 [Candidatus Komeilibacteria bacterium CG_4_9_14_3_um_filter_37_5]
MSLPKDSQHELITNDIATLEQKVDKMLHGALSALGERETVSHEPMSARLSLLVRELDKRGFNTDNKDPEIDAIAALIHILAIEEGWQGLVRFVSENSGEKGHAQPFVKWKEAVTTAKSPENTEKAPAKPVDPEKIDSIRKGVLEKVDII